jgi:hypothetical protein
MQTPNHSYMLLLHERPADAADLSPAQMSEIVARYQAWAADLAQRGLLVSGEKLTDDGGRHLRLAGGRPVASDGPYAEAHDVVGGYFIVKAVDDDAAQALAATCPHLAGTQWIEIRRIEPMG